jgi:hypothetical protein
MVTTTRENSRDLQVFRDEQFVAALCTFWITDGRAHVEYAGTRERLAVAWWNGREWVAHPAGFPEVSGATLDEAVARLFLGHAAPAFGSGPSCVPWVDWGP